jgi:uncharacterized protein YggE
MERTIQITGTGHVSQKPDLVVITMELRALEKDYKAAMAAASDRLKALQNSLAEIGIDKKDLKTTNFRVNTEYETVRDEENNKSYSVFQGYSVENNLKLEFEWDAKRLGEVLNAIAACESNPEFRIRFSVKNPEEMKTKLLEDAADNARKVSETLCRASGVSLGKLLRINYSWEELDIYSPTSYNIGSAINYAKNVVVEADIAPDDINVSDTVTFIWEIS